MMTPTPIGTVVRRLARWLGVTEGQAYTLVIALIVGMVTAAFAIPPTLR